MVLVTNKISKFWFCAAACFMVVGTIYMDRISIILACAYICLGYANLDKKSKEERKEKI